ncbi:MAG: hypothetical protein IH897_04410 [Planctomycetes bacterium]|nr:hypothetical protein [Planctomycetota bacterium]
MTITKQICLAVVLNAAILTLGISRVNAQQAGGAQGEGGKGYDHQHSRLDISFPGGTLQAYVEAIRLARPTGAANVVVTPNAKTLPVPPVSLVAVTVEAAVQMLEGSYTAKNGEITHVGVETYAIGDSPDLLMKIVAEKAYHPVRSAVWSVEQALAAGQTTEELLGAVEAVLSLFSQKAEISYHPPTRLLIARGTDEQLELVREALNELIESAERRHDMISALREQIDPLEGELTEIEGEMRISEQVVAVAKMRLETVREQVKHATAPAVDAAEAELQVTRTQTEMELLIDRRRRVQNRLNALRKSLEKWEQPRE